ncbi:MAG: uroporphyrinogen-III synthase [Gemmatimonadota bacterium]
MNGTPLAGKRVLITRDAEGSEEWARSVAQLGGRPLILPCIVEQPIDDAAAAAALRGALADAEWLLVFSARAARCVARLCGGDIPASTRIGAVGRRSASAASRYLRPPSLVGSVGTSLGLAFELLPLLEACAANAKVVIAGATFGREDADAFLHSAGVLVRRVSVYRVVPWSSAGRKRDLSRRRVDAVLLASPSAVKGLINRVKLPLPAKVVTIGPTTSAAAEAAGLEIAAEAKSPSLASMLAAIQ